MKKQVAAAAAALVAGAFLCSPALAQNPAGANAQKFGVAVVDINYIFKNNPLFKSKMDGMKADFEKIETSVKGRQQQIIDMQERKKLLTPGSAEFKQVDEQIVKMNANLQVEVTQQRKELVEREAKIYYETYLQVSQAISYYAERQGIGLVLRFNGEQADPANRESILRNINKAIHYQNSIDITPDIEVLLNRMASNQAGGTTR